MARRILIDAVYPDETRVVIHDNNRVQDFDYETSARKQLKGNIYLAKVTRVEPSLQAAFVEYGGNKHGFLPFAEIHPDYYHIPISDRPVTEEGEVWTESEAGAEEIGRHIRAITPPEFSLDDQEEEDEQEKITLETLRTEAIIIEPAAEAAEGEEVAATGENAIAGTQHAEGGVADIPALPALEVVEAWEEEKTDDEAVAFDRDTADEEVDEDDETLGRRKRSTLYRQYKIQEVIKRNQVILVQVIKEERGNKGASLTSYISLAGRYCVLMPNSDRQGGISRRISNPEDRKRLRTIIDSFNVPEGASVIVRTAGAGRSKADIKRDYDYLVRLWNSIREYTLASKAPAFIHAEGDLIKRVVRDMYDHTIDEVLIQGDEAYRSAKDFMKMVMPSHMSKIKHFRSKAPLFGRYQVEEQLSSLYNQVVHLESGGYIVINPTEALISIDVNSGKSTSERNIEETATKTNLEAAYEVARQSRLRDLSGLIVIDFIDMMEGRNRRAVERALKEALQFDRAKVQLGRISPFGLLEMSRQRLRSSFLEANAVGCSHCAGRGVVRTPGATAMMILRAIESEVYRGDSEAINIYAHVDTITYMLNHKRAELQVIENTHRIRIFFYPDTEIRVDGFATEKIKQLQTSGKQEAALLPYVDEQYVIEEEVPDVEEESEPMTSPGRKKNWKQNKAVEAANVPAASQEEENNKHRKRKRSGGGRNNASKRSRHKKRGEGEKERSLETEGEVTALVPVEVGKEEGSKKRGQRRKKEPEAAVKGEGESLLKGLWKRIIE